MGTEEFAKECNALTRAQHANVVRMLGVCVDDGVFLVMELCSHGNLHSFVVKHRNLPAAVRLWYALQVYNPFLRVYGCFNFGFWIVYHSNDFFKRK